MAKLRKMLTHRGKNESGQGALAMVLILLMLGAIILTPLLVFMTTGLKAGQVYESKMQEFYAADAGIEDGSWQIEHGHLDEKFTSPLDYDLYDYYTNYNYTLVDEVNDEIVNVNITNVWIPDMDTPSPEAARQIIENGTLIITGSSAESTYQIKINYDYGAEGTDALKVKEIGIWLPPGFHYVEGSCSLNDQDYYSEPSPAPYKSGEAVVWNFASVPLVDFPGGAGSPMVKSFTFTFSAPSELDLPGAAISWIDTTGVNDLVPGFSDITYTWDADVKPYKIESTAGSITTEAYTAEIGVRKLGAAVEGDYFATGNSLIGYSHTDKYRDRLYQEGEATIVTDVDGIDGIPSEATVEAAFLYWSGWIDFNYKYCTRWDRHGHCTRWREGDVGALKYPSNPTPENLTIVVEQEAKVNNVSLSIGGNVTEVTAYSWQVFPRTGDPDLVGSWSYACYADVTDLVKGAIEAEEIGANGAGAYVLSHSSAVIGQHRPETEYYFTFYDTGDATGYPLGTPALEQSGLRYQRAYAGWSLVIIYSSPETKGHQLYLYDIENPGFVFTHTWIEEAGIANPDFDGDGNPGGKISGFLVPERVQNSDGTWEENAAKLTVFVGEGDSFIEDDQLLVNSQEMSNDESPPDNVWNSESPGLEVPGVDIDTFYIEWDDAIIEPGDTSAQVDLPATSYGSGSDGFSLVYIILSFRSEITTGGTISYLLRGG